MIILAQSVYSYLLLKYSNATQWTDSFTEPRGSFRLNEMRQATSIIQASPNILIGLVQGSNRYQRCETLRVAMAPASLFFLCFLTPFITTLLGTTVVNVKEAFHRQIWRRVSTVIRRSTQSYTYCHENW